MIPLFLSTLSLRRATHFPCTELYQQRYFYPRSPCGERPFSSCIPNRRLKISIHALLAESDHSFSHAIIILVLFLSTLSLRRATTFTIVWSRLYFISIHALLAESDIHGRKRIRTPKYFYPRSPCGERRKPRRLKSRRCVFLSTLSLRRATPIRDIIQWEGMNFYPRSPCGERRNSQNIKRRHNNFYPRSPCGERPGKGQSGRTGIDISIHALLAESDSNRPVTMHTWRISIHALLAESDSIGTLRTVKVRNFYPRSPCGERLSALWMEASHLLFLSTLSLRRATLTPKSTTGQTLIFLSTLSLRRATRAPPYKLMIHQNFYPRSPCGERPPSHNLYLHNRRFLSTLSLRRATLGRVEVV